MDSVDGSELAEVLSTYAGVCAGIALILWGGRWLVRAIWKAAQLYSRLKSRKNEAVVGEGERKVDKLQQSAFESMTGLVGLVTIAVLIAAAFSNEGLRGYGEVFVGLLAVGMVFEAVAKVKGCAKVRDGG